MTQPPHRPRGRARPAHQKPRRAQPSRPPPEGWESRRAAAILLLASLEPEGDLDDALGSVADYARLAPVDRAFARAMASAALRALGRIDAVLRQFLSRPIEELDPLVLSLLRIGCAQLWLLGSPPYAAISSVVEAARHMPDATRAGGMINAVLRRADRERSTFENAPASSVWPDWLAARMRSALGEPAAGRLAAAQLDEPPIDLTLKPHLDAEDWAQKLGGAALPGGGVRLKSGAPLADRPGYGEGDWWVQDAGAALPARLFRGLSGRSAVDLCAAPGGKAMQLAAAGAVLTAVEASADRIVRLKENFARTRLPAEIVMADARSWTPPSLFDAVLLDAPCSALGTLRRHPEGAWSRRPEDLSRYPRLQVELLAAAIRMTRPGGEIVYCVCTPLPEEGVDVVTGALEAGGVVRRPIAASEVVGFEHAVTDEGDLLTLPPAIASDAAIRSDVFYIARLERTG